ncbi:peptidase inhibitor 16 [Suncus etruscus]|uniref:peptidase inhibitor 16 n=1 Tax=Suncus etruscus TaxID=109475 RepID=UPI00210FACBC|nr:peptidase inhibitor 16 [Suncus etruscus]
MHSSHCLRALPLPLLFLLACISGLAAALTEEERDVMVQLHNFYRSQVEPPAANMLHMSWDPELAAFAKAYAEKCVWGHNKERGRRGENLFAITDRGLDVPLAVGEWQLEYKHYNFSSNACNESQMCGHYTQVIWAKTDRIGCGSHFCEKLEGIEEPNIQLLVCNYEPPGNVKGQRPYQEGTPCSQCPTGYRCEKSLCEPIKEQKEAPDIFELVLVDSSSTDTEDSVSKKTGIASSPATKTPSSLVTKTTVSLATQGPSSLATKKSPLMATKVPTSFSATHKMPILDKVTASSPRSSHTSAPQPTAKEASSTRTTFMTPKTSQLPRMSLAGTHELPLHVQEETEVEAELLLSREGLHLDSPVQGEPGEPEVTLNHTAHNSESLSISPDTSATAHAEGALVLALQSSLPGAEGPERPSVRSGQNSGPDLLWGSLLGQLLLPSLVLARIF